MSDVTPEFEEEQAHLTRTYAKLEQIEESTQRALKKRLSDALGDRANMLDELAVDFNNGVNLETYVEYEAINQVIDSYNLSNEVDIERLDRVHLLLRQPYFAKVVLQFPNSRAPREIYIGACGMTDDAHKHFIVDWRSPIAETYYNQENGPTSYEANGRVINVDLKLRRQFDIQGSTLNACFDTTLPIEDPLLLQSLARGRSAKMRDITATIQKEQNLVIRHEDVPALLVNGIAGSGKTSVLLQRIAFLLYRHRDDLDPSDVYLITPNPVFQSYISEVLPEMGETNPRALTWHDLMVKLGLEGLGKGINANADNLRILDAALPTLELDARDFQDLRIDDECVISASQARSAYNKFKRFEAGIHRSTLTAEELHERLDARINRLVNDEETQDDVLDLSEAEMTRIFGHVIYLVEGDEIKEWTRTYLNDRYAPIREAIDNGEWLNVNRIGMRILKQSGLNSAEWLFLKLALAGGNNRDARFVMIDEVQDYSEAQLMVLARYFCNAHFLLLGDQNQAIKEQTATFEQIRDVFANAKGSVSECQLATSYRSSPEITALFTKLMDPDQNLITSSVRREGTEPLIRECSDDDYLSTLRELIEEARIRLSAEKDDQSEANQAASPLTSNAKKQAGMRGLCAIICADYQRVKWLGKQLGDSVQMLNNDTQLPENGIVLLDLTLAKGLEFDEVIVADAQQSVYDESDLCRHRLYTSISRATKRVSIISQGHMTKLLD